MEPLCQIVTPVGMIGYGFSEEQTEAALKEFSSFQTPTALVLDAGSTDSGPSKLALGTTTCPKSSYIRDFRKLLVLSTRYGIPLLISSAGGDGSDDHVDLFLDIIREISEEPENASWELKTLAIYSEIPKDIVLERLEAGKISGCGPSVPPLTTETITETTRIVAQMGPEPLLDAIAAHPDFNVLIAGRSYDPAPHIAFMAHHVMKSEGLGSFTDLSAEILGGFSHMGKILECGGLCATPKSMGAAGIMNKNASFDIKPLDLDARCTPLSVAAHTLYEKTRPDILHGPGGYIDLSQATFTQLEDGRSVRVQGSVFHLDRATGTTYTVKLEGAKIAGYRTLTMGSFRDPILIPQIHAFLERGEELVKKQHSHVSEPWDLGFHVYGFDEKRPDLVPGEVFIVAEAIAQSQQVATSLASAMRIHCIHGSYPHQKATSGNFAMGIGGMLELETKACAEFSVYHLMDLSADEEGARPIPLPQADIGSQRGLFRWKELEIGLGLENTHPSAPATTLSPAPLRTSGTKGTVAPAMMTTANPNTLFDIAKVIRSKNSGPFEITLDVMFDDIAVYNAVKSSDVLNTAVIANLYKFDTSEVIWAGFFDAAMAFKATVPRKRRGQPSCSGGFLEDDVHGSQQYIPLAELRLPQTLITALKATA